MTKNVLFIMCDQLRYDYLGCAGHPTIRTPNIDALASRGVRFDQAYVQSTICGPSRMSFYTGRYVRSHGSLWNEYPLRIGEMTLGDHLRPLGVRTALCGKTHMEPDQKGMKRLGIEMDSKIGALTAECGFEVWDRNDGIVPDGAKKQPSHYNEYLKVKGYDGENPWHSWSNSAESSDGDLLSGWLMKHASEPARVAEEDSETTYATTRAIEFMEQAKDENWCLHLSYIKPHWPYIVPTPYNDLYGSQDVIPVKRTETERKNPHPVLEGFLKHRYSQSFCDPIVRETVIPAYMGLITQIDDQVGRIVKYLEDSGQADDTLIVFTSDHGDYLGDHWLGEKELFHDASARVPLIVMDPSPEADGTRGRVEKRLVEAIDLVPTFVEYFGGTPPRNILEGQSLVPFLYETGTIDRRYVISEYDYASLEHLKHLGSDLASCKLVMVYDGRWKMIWAQGYRPMLYDLDTDPKEFFDLGAEPAHKEVRKKLTDYLLEWGLREHNRVATSDQDIESMRTDEAGAGVLIGFWDQDQLDEWHQKHKTR